MLLRLTIIGLLYAFISQSAVAVDVPITTFPLTNYSQNINYWIDSTATTYDQPLVSADYQQQRTQDFI